MYRTIPIVLESLISRVQEYEKVYLYIVAGYIIVDGSEYIFQIILIIKPDDVWASDIILDHGLLMDAVCYIHPYNPTGLTNIA